MGRKYIIELPEGTYWIQWIMKGTKDGHHYMDFMDVEDLTPYIEPDLEQIRKEAYDKGFDAGRTLNNGKYEKGLNDAWEAARKIAHCFLWGSYQRETGRSSACAQAVLDHYSASEAIEKIRQYEQKKEEQKEEKPILVEDVMRQYLKIFCDNHWCSGDKCLLHTPEFTCGRGKHFLSLPHERVSDEEVRRAYAKVMKENNND